MPAHWCVTCQQREARPGELVCSDECFIAWLTELGEQHKDDHKDDEEEPYDGRP